MWDLHTFREKMFIGRWITERNLINNNAMKVYLNTLSVFKYTFMPWPKFCIHYSSNSNTQAKSLGSHLVNKVREKSSNLLSWISTGSIIMHQSVKSPVYPTPTPDHPFLLGLYLVLNLMQKRHQVQLVAYDGYRSFCPITSSTQVVLIHRQFTQSRFDPY